MLTPLALSAGGAFTIECPASDVLCHRQGTVNETSGFRHRLFDSGSCPLSRTVVFPKPTLTLSIRIALAPNGLRTAPHTIQNVFRRISELREFYPASRCYQPGCPREASNTAYPFVRHFPSCDGILRDPSSKGASVPVELDHVSLCVSFNATQP